MASEGDTITEIHNKFPGCLISSFAEYPADTYPPSLHIIHLFWTYMSFLQKNN